MEKRLKRLVFILAIVGMPLGARGEMEHTTTSFRMCLTWFGLRISPYRQSEDGMSTWVKNKLHLRPEHEAWSPTSGGPFWLSYHVGTPRGNWFLLHNVYKCYLVAPEREKEEVCDIARQIVSKEYRDTWNELSNAAVERWLH